MLRSLHSLAPRVAGVFAILLGLSGRLLADEALTARAMNVLKTQCYTCHGVNFQVPGLDVLDRDILTAARGEKFPYLTPGDPQKSELWRQIDSGLMPYDGSEIPQADLDALKQWIEDGAPFPTVAREARPFVSEEELLLGVKAHLNDVNRNVRPFYRFFSIAHLHNNRSVTDAELRLTRAALAKTINSLCRQRRLVEMEPVSGTNETLYAVDLREAGWTESWDKVEDDYPYALKPADLNLEEVFDDIEQLHDFSVEPAYNGVPYLRADWFINKALRPPLYHDLLGLPQTVQELEQELGVDREGDFERSRLIRGGVVDSGVSAHNRLVDYHGSQSGAYWISYDFENTAGKGNLMRFPLGPKSMAGDKFSRFSFDHAGGEIIFELPNGLHAYMLIDEKGGRIDSGPISIVADREQISGSPEIVNGLSCIACHKNGMKMFDDKIMQGHAVLDNRALSKMRELYDAKGLRRELERSQNAYLRTLQDVIGDYVQVGEDANKQIEEFPEPITAVVRRYDRDLSLEDVACELGVDGAAGLKGQLGNRALFALGLGALRNDGHIKRSVWDNVAEDVTSVFQETAKELQIGTPIIP